MPIHLLLFMAACMLLVQAGVVAMDCCPGEPDTFIIWILKTCLLIPTLYLKREVWVVEDQLFGKVLS